jgi:hypothetical protein
VDPERRQKLLEAIVKREAELHAKKLSNDQQYWDLVNFSRDHIGRASHDALLRFKWAEYGYSEGCAAVSFVLCTLLAVVNRELSISPEQFAEMAKERLIHIREHYEDDEEDEDE